MHFVPQTPSSCLANPPDHIILCYSILGSTLDMNKDQAIHGVGISQPISTVIHEEYEWDLEHQHSVKDDSLLSKPPSFFPNIFDEPAIHDFSFVSTSMDAPIIDHSQDTPDMSPPFENGEDNLFIENPLNLSSSFSRNTEDEFVRFSSTPLFGSLDYEHANEIIDFSNHECHDPCTPIFNHDHDSIAVDFSKPPVYDDISNDKG